MPYLQRPRLQFAGRFTADVSTYNNTDANFPIQGFDPNTAPLWNPTGSGDYSIAATVTAVCYEDGTTATTPQQDSIVGTAVTGMAATGAAGKLVDLDPDQQMVSSIWCLQISVGTAITGDFTTAAFTDIWGRMPQGSGMASAGAFFQSQLTTPVLTDPGNSRFFTELKAAAGNQPLSIRFNVDAMVGDSTNTQYFPTGRIVGAIGTAQPGEPQHVTRGRQLFATSMLSPNGAAYGNAVAIVDRTAGKVVVDLGNMLPVNVGSGDGLPGSLIDNGPISVGTAAQFDLLGTLQPSTYTGADWYPQTAGIVDLPVDRKLTVAELDMLESTTLQISTGAGSSAVIAQEENGGKWVRADGFVFRQSPGDVANVMLYATSFGKPLANETIQCMIDANALNSTPPSALPGMPVTVVTNADGVAQLPIAIADPGAPRRLEDIDGQVFAVRPALALAGGSGVQNPADFVSILVWSGYQAPAQPTWWNDAWPILQQFANLYPVMKQQGIIDLGNYADVAAKKGLVKFVLSLATSNPSYMPVTRDLSPAKQQMLLAWLATTGGPNGGPNEGTQPSHVATALAGAVHAAKELVVHAREAVTHPVRAPRRDHENYQYKAPHKKHDEQ